MSAVQQTTQRSKAHANTHAHMHRRRTKVARVQQQVRGVAETRRKVQSVRRGSARELRCHAEARRYRQTKHQLRHGVSKTTHAHHTFIIPSSSFYLLLYTSLKHLPKQRTWVQVK